MRKYFFLIVCLICGMYAQAGVHRCGTYNIRTCYGEADTGERHWDKRKAALITVIRDTMQFDILGINEARDKSLAYLKDSLGSIYAFYGNSTDYQNQVMYRKDKYTCLDQGYFYLAADPSKRSKSWDDDGYHLTVWVKLQDKQTGEIIVFGSTHMSLYPIAIRESARVNAEQMTKIAGPYACIVTGDTNSEPTEHDSHANFGKLMGNARQMSKTAPQGSYGTYIPGMNPYDKDAKLLDFLYVRNVEIESYFAYNKGTKGRDLAPSDHQPVVCEVTILNPKRALLHQVSTVAELRQVAHDMQPNDTIRLCDGLYDLGDSTLYIANTCVIEGSKNVVITGRTQLFSLPNYISLEMNGITIKNAISNTFFKGSIMYAHGDYLKMTDCVIDSCTAVGEGLIYTQDCATTLENCIFRNNYNKEQNAGLQIASSLGVDRYPLVVKNCLFDNNYSYYAPALYYTGEATAYIYSNSFVNNSAEEKGAIVLYAPNNSKDIRLVNNTLVNNRIDVEAGFMVDGIGGSAIWQEQAAKGKMTLMHNTIVGNYTACWDAPGVSSTEFMGGAVCAYSGLLTLYNNVLAGNYGSKPNSGDLTVDDFYNVKGVAYNVFTSKNNMQITPTKNDFASTDYATACIELKKLYGGTIDQQGIYHPQLHEIEGKSLPVLSPMEAMCYGKNIAVLDDDARSAATVSSDILNKGTNTGILAVDQVGYVRAYNSVPGAMEQGKYTPSAIIEPFADSTSFKHSKFLINGHILIQQEDKLYDLLGNSL